MTRFVDQLRLAERAEEDIYFARIDRELIDALHQHARLDGIRQASQNQADTQAHIASEQDE